MIDHALETEIRRIVGAELARLLGTVVRDHERHPRETDAIARLTFVQGWASLCSAAGLPALTGAQAVARLYPAPSGPDRWDALRDAVAYFTRSPGEPSLAALGEAMRRRVAVGPVGGLLLYVDGKSAGRARWRVVAWEPRP